MGQPVLRTNCPRIRTKKLRNRNKNRWNRGFDSTDSRYQSKSLGPEESVKVDSDAGGIRSIVVFASEVSCAIGLPVDEHAGL